MCAVLAGAHQPVDLVGGGIVSPNELVDLGGEVDFALREGDAVRAAQRAQVDPAQLLLAHEVDHGNGAAGISRAIVGNEGQLPIGRRCHLMRAFADGNATRNFSRRRIDGGQRTFFLVQNQQRRRGHFHSGQICGKNQGEPDRPTDRGFR